MPKVDTIVVGGGISATSPFTVNTLQMAASTSPPSVTDSVFKQSSNGKSLSMGLGASFGTADDQIVIGRASVAPAAAVGTTFIGSAITGGQVAAGFAPNIGIGGGPITFNAACTGGIVVNATLTTLTGDHTNTVALLAGGTVADAGRLSVVIGGRMTITVGQSRNVLIGDSVFCSSGAASDNTIIGASATGGNGAQKVVVLGSNAGIGSVTAVRAIVIGYASTLQIAADDNILIGSQIIGRNTQQIIIGGGVNDTTLPNNSAIIGGPNTIISTVVFGRGGQAATVGDVTIRLTDRSGAGNLAGSDLILQSGAGRGNDVTKGNIIFNTPVSAGLGVLQTFSPRVTIFTGGGMSIAAPDTVANALTIAANAGAPASVNLTGLTNGAAAAAGTLNNAPAAGNPTFWIPIQIAGVTKFIPAW